MNVFDLRVNGVAGFFCLDEGPARFSWKLSGGQGLCQAACRLRVATSEERLAEPDLWDSGRVEGGRSWYIPYGGKALPAFARVFWEAEVFGTDGSVAAARAWFATGRLDTAWPSPWFEAPAGISSFPLFRRGFSVQPGWSAARVYACGLGAFELYLNDTRVGECELEPGWTNFDKRVPYTAYDVGQLLRAGGNCLGLMLGGGMYSIDQSGTRYAYSRHSFGPPKATLVLVVDYPNGETAVVSGADEWYAAPGPLTFSCIYGGEDYDARLEIPGFSLPEFQPDTRWAPARECPAPKGTLRCRENPPVVVRRRLSPVRAQALSPTETVYDLGRNFAGRVRVTAKGRPGQTLRVYFAELLTEEGDLLPITRYTEPYYHEYTFAGHGEESWHARFTYYGFRYVKVVTEAQLIDLAGEDMFSDMPSGGSFRCSNNLWNGIHNLILRAVESNAKSVFTDCPHREKMGWLEQLHLIGPGILCNFDAVPMLRKCLADMREAQLEDGMMPTTAPEYRIFDWMPAFRDSPEWGSSCILLVRQMYDASGDEALLRDNYEMMRRYADYLVGKTDHMILRYGLGDWDDVGCKKSLSTRTPIPVTATCTLYQDLCTVAWAARQLGKQADAARYADLAQQVKDEYNKEFFNPRLGQYATGSQTALAMPLVFGMAGEEHVPKVLANLVDDVREQGDHLTGGDGGHNYLFEALGMLGRSDVVSDILVRRDYPSYGFHLEMGATALPELWNGAVRDKPAGSQNHLMMGGADAWFYRYLAGIQVQVDGDCVAARIAPQVVHSTEWVDASVETVAGVVRSRWQVEGDVVRYTVEIPAGVRASIELHGLAPIQAAGESSITAEGPRPDIG